MPVSPAAAALTFVALVVLVAGVWGWLIAAAKAALTWRWVPQPAASNLDALLGAMGLSPRLPLIAWAPRPFVPWAFVDLALMFGIYLIALFVVSVGMHQLGWLPSGAGDVEKFSLNERQRLIVVNIVASVLVGIVGLFLVAVRSGATARDLGLSWHEFWADMRLGFIGFVMLAPPVYALQGLLVYLWKPSKHPLMELFKETPDAAFFLVLFVSAAVVAPIFEEFMFRVLLQGFLEKAVSFRGDAHELLMGAQNSVAANPNLDLPVPSIAENPFAPTHTAICEVQIEPTFADQPELRAAASWLPIAIASAIFALLHYTHGPDWIPLFILAAGMGYLYQRTHRLLPSLVVHASLNGLSMWGLWVQVKEGFSS